MKSYTYDVFLSGPITGCPDYAADFAAAELAVRQRLVRADGRALNIWNPAKLPPDMTYAWYMRQCVEAVFDTAHYAMLPGWEKSPGAIAERALAQSLRLPEIKI